MAHRSAETPEAWRLALAIANGLRALDGFDSVGWAAAWALNRGLCALHGLLPADGLVEPERCSPPRILRAFRVELDPTVEQRRYLQRASGVARSAHNWVLYRWRAEATSRGLANGLRALDGFPTLGWSASWAVNRGLCALHGQEPAPGLVEPERKDQNGYRFHAELTAIKGEQFPWMREVSAFAVREGVADVDDGYKHFFHKLREGKSAGPPKFRKRKNGRRWHCDQGSAVRVRSNAVWCPGLARLGSGDEPKGWIKVMRGRVGYLPTNAGTKLCAVSFRERAGRWYAVVRAEVPNADPDPRNPGTRMAVEVGVRVLAQTSTGRKFASVRSFDAITRATRRLRLWERRQERRYKKGIKTCDQSTGWHQAVGMVQRYHREIADARADALHQCSRRIVDMGAEVIVMRDNDVAGMLARDAQTTDAARQRRNRIAPLVAQMGGMYELRRQVTYKQQWAGGTVELVPEDEPTTLRCSVCRAVRDTDPGYPDFSCPACGHVEDREANSARNLHDFFAVPGNGGSGKNTTGSGNGNGGAGGRAVRQKRRKPRTAGGTGPLGAEDSAATSPEGGATSVLGPGNHAPGEQSPGGTDAVAASVVAVIQVDGGMVPPISERHTTAHERGAPHERERSCDADPTTETSRAHRSQSGPQGRGSPRDPREPSGAAA